jgi:large subunit ribosomal protein L24
LFDGDYVKTRKARSQRKARAVAALHARGSFLHAHLSKELRAKLKKRAIRIRKGDKVKILRGDFAGKEGKVAAVNLRKSKISVEGVTHRRARGQERFAPVDPSKVVITELAERK